MTDETFDVFLSHNSKDKPVVRQIAEALRDGRRLKVWLDEWELPPGRPWQDELDKIIRAARSAAVLVGKDGLGPWEIPEMRACLSQMVKRGLPVIPVLLPDAPKAPDLPVFLAENTWVDLRGEITEEGLDRLEWGITGKKPNRRTTKPQSRGPRLHNLPYPPLGDLLKGRDEDLRSLETGQATAITQAISGLGGIGKTRLAVEYAWRSGERYNTALFVVADSPEGLRSGLAKLAGPDLLNLPEYEAGVEAKTVVAVRRWLREHDRWLLILDNVDTTEAQEAVMEALPSLSSGRVLITSRLRDWAASVQSQPIETLSLAEAQRFLLERTAKHRTLGGYDEEEARRLAEELGRLPLALEQAAAYIAHHQTTFIDYLKFWERERNEVLTWHNKNVMQYPASVAATWQTTLRRLSPMATTILRLTAYLAPDPIPIEMFETGEEILKEAVGLLCEETGEQSGTPSIKESIAELISYSIVSREGANFTVHRIVQEVLRTRIPEERRRDWIERSLGIVDGFSPPGPDDVRTWPVWDPIRPHAVLVLQYADAAGISDPTTRLMSQLALLLDAKSLYREAEPLIRRALQIDQKFFGPKSPEVAADLNNLGSLLQSTNRLVEAEPLMRQALEIDENTLGSQHAAVASDLNNLAQLLKATNRLTEAELLMRRALKINKKALGPQHASIAIYLNNLARLLQDTGRLAEAEPLMRRALKIEEKAFGPQHPNVARHLGNLAMLLRSKNQPVDAAPLVRRALKIDENAFGPHHPTVALSLSRLAILLYDTDQLKEAEALMRRALRIDEDSFGTHHPCVAIDLNNLAKCLHGMGRLTEAEPLMRRALQIDEDSFGTQHPNVAIRLHNLAQLLQTTNRLEDAEPLMQRAVKIFEQSLGPDHPDTQVARDNLVFLLQESSSEPAPSPAPKVRQKKTKNLNPK